MGFSYVPDNSFSSAPSSSSIMGGIPAVGGTILLFLLLCIGLGVLIGLVFYIFQAIGIMKMHKQLGLNGGWMAFLPVLNVFAFGKVGQQYIKQNGKKSAKFSVILLIFSLVSVFCSMLTMLFSFLEISALTTGINSEIVDVLLIFSLLTEIGYTIFAVVYAVVFYIALWRIYAIFSNQNASILLILSIFFPILQPFFIFGIRNKEPMCVELNKETVAEEIPDFAV